MINKSPLPIKTSCNLLNASTSGYYSWTKKVSTDNDEKICNQIRIIAEEYPKYGYRRVYHQLKRNGITCNTKRIRRIMKEENLLVKQKKKGPVTTQSNHGFKKPENLIKDLEIYTINQVFVADITYIRLEKDFVYLALIMDLCSRRVVGWELSRNPDTQLTLGALNRAIKLRGKTNLKGCIHHSDNGVQYASNLYVMRLGDLGMLPSMGEIGNSYDNAHAESLNKTIKNEEVWMNEYETFEMAYLNIENFIEEVYNKKRLHSSIGYVPPIEFEKSIIMEQRET